MAVRTTIQLDEALVKRLREMVPPRGLNRFINETLAEKVESLERKRIEELMKEGYLATRDDRDELNVDWEVVDLEGWPEW
jgi:hypothetical protein